MSVINVRQELALAQVEIARLRAEVERLHADAEEAQRQVQTLTDERCAAEARVAELEAAAKALMRFSPHVTCEEVHHGPGDHHGSMESCPPTIRYMEAKSALRALLAPREPIPEPKPCGACGGSGSVWDGPTGLYVPDGGAMRPCPDCRGGRSDEC